MLPKAMVLGLKTAVAVAALAVAVNSTCPASPRVDRPRAARIRDAKPAPPEAGQEQPVIGWRCADYRRLPDDVRATLSTPTVVGPTGPRSAEAIVYDFNLSRYDERGQTIGAYVSWSGAGEELADRNLHALYFTIYAPLAPGDALVLEAPGGQQIRLPEDVHLNRYTNAGSPEAAVNLTQKPLIRRLLAHRAYKVTAKRAGRSVRAGFLRLFSLRDARTAHSNMLARLKAKMTHPAQSCTPVLPPERQPNDIT